MGHHDRIHTCADCLLEWWKLNVLQSRQVALYFGHSQMRIGGGVAMSWKMFCGGQHPMGPRAADKRGHQITDLRRTFSARTCIDNAAVRVAIAIGNRSHIPM